MERKSVKTKHGNVVFYIKEEEITIAMGKEQATLSEESIEEIIELLMAYKEKK